MGYQNIRLLGGAIVTADLSEKAKCKFCHKDIVWAVTKNVKNMPIVQDQSGNWIAHMVDCIGWPANKKARIANDRLADHEMQKQRSLW
jgi:hypothetical protein